MRYQIYQIDWEGRPLHLEEIECESEAEARERARQLTTEHVVELWQWPRRVARFTPGPED